MRSNNKNPQLIAIALCSALVLILAPWLGTHPINWEDVFGPDATVGSDIFWKLRVPRVITGFLAGAALAIGGAVFQSVFRNSLAEPFTLGVSAGASAGMVFAIFLGFTPLAGGFIPAENIFAFCGALIAIVGVYMFALRRGEASPSGILLAGVSVNFFFSSLIMLIQHLVDPYNAARIIRAMIGGVSGSGVRQLLFALPFILPGALVSMLHWRELDIMACGEDIALSRGVDTTRVRRTLYFAVSLMVGGITALCGPVGFVGLVAPHVCRTFVGPGHARLLPASALVGGSFLVAADLLSRTLIPPAELPVGILSALCGAPFFLYLLRRNKNALF